LKIIELNNNQAALILDVGEDGSITVNVNAEDMDGLAGKLCIAIAKKIINDEEFQAEFMGMMEDE